MFEFRFYGMSEERRNYLRETYRNQYRECRDTRTNQIIIIITNYRACGIYDDGSIEIEMFTGPSEYGMFFINSKQFDWLEVI